MNNKIIRHLGDLSYKAKLLQNYIETARLTVALSGSKIQNLSALQEITISSLSLHSADKNWMEQQMAESKERSSPSAHPIETLPLAGVAVAKEWVEDGTIGIGHQIAIGDKTHEICAIEESCFYGDDSYVLQFAKIDSPEEN